MSLLEGWQFIKIWDIWVQYDFLVRGRIDQRDRQDFIRRQQPTLLDDDMGHFIRRRIQDKAVDLAHLFPICREYIGSFFEFHLSHLFHIETPFPKSLCICTSKSWSK